MIITKVKRIISNPRRYLIIAAKRIPIAVAGLLANRTCYLQSQMDIHPKSLFYKSDFVKATGGFHPSGTDTRSLVHLLETYDTTRRDMLTLLLRSVEERRITGAIAELGVYRGSTAKLFHHYAPQRELYLFDTFEGFAEEDIQKEYSTTGYQLSTSHFADTSVQGVLNYINPVQAEKVKVVRGMFPHTVTQEIERQQFCFVHLDADLYQPIKAALEFFYPKVSSGGFIVIHDYNAWEGARKAVDEFFRDRPETVIPMPDKSGSALVAKF